MTDSTNVERAVQSAHAFSPLKRVQSPIHASMCEDLFLRPIIALVWLQVSCTITFDPSEEGSHLAHALDYFQYQLKGVSFLPRMDYGAFPQVCVLVGWPIMASVGLAPFPPWGPYFFHSGKSVQATAPSYVPPPSKCATTCSPSWPRSQMPYEAISEEQYTQQASKLRKLDFTRRDGQPPRGGVRVEEVPDKFCETDACVNSVSGSSREWILNLIGWVLSPITLEHFQSFGFRT